MTRPKVPTTREVMTRRVVTLSPEMAAVDAAGVLLKHKISGAPVVDDQGRLLGLLSEFDVLKAVAAADYEMDPTDVAHTVADLMSKGCITISPEMDLFGLATEFVTHGVRRFPVVEDGKLVGQVSRRDALRAAVELRRKTSRSHHAYPDYPEGRRPIRNYPGS